MGCICCLFICLLFVSSFAEFLPDCTEEPYHMILWFGPVILCFVFNCYVYLRLTAALFKVQQHDIFAIWFLSLGLLLLFTSYCTRNYSFINVFSQVVIGEISSKVSNR